MSIITIQLGQCGNQVGHEIFDAICKDAHSARGFCSKKENDSYQAACKERFFSEEKRGGEILWDATAFPRFSQDSTSEFSLSISNPAPNQAESLFLTGNLPRLPSEAWDGQPRR